MSIPSNPQNIIVQTGNTQVYLCWDQVVGANNYVVQRSTTGLLGSFTTIASLVVNNYLDTSVVAGIQYWYQVAAQDALGNTSGYTAYSTNGSPLQVVPCLPGQINLGYLRYQAKLKADMLNSQFLTDDEWNFAINQSATKLYDLLVTKFGDDYFMAPMLTFNTNGTDTYPLPDGMLYSSAPAMYKLMGVDAGINASNNQWFTLPRFNLIDRNRYSTLQLAGTVQSIYGLAYAVFGNNLYFIPNPQSAQIIRLRYVPMLEQMLKDTDMMPFSISGWSELVIIDAAIKALTKEESFDQAMMLVNERTQLVARIEETAANRDVGQPNTISNTRARAGDPNFGYWSGSSGFSNGGFGGWG